MSVGLSCLLVSSALLGNAMLAFIFASALIWPLSRLAPSPAIRKWMLCAPVLKVFWDLSRGVPGNAYALSRFAGQRWELGAFQLGMGAKAPWSLLTLTGKLGARRDHMWFALSGGDLPVNALNHRGWGGLVGVAVVGVLALSAVGLYRYLAELVRHHRTEVVRRADARVLESRRVGPWQVRVLESDDNGPAHVAGVIAPVIWLPQRACSWSAARREAVLQHELAHIQNLDVLLFGVLGMCVRLLWFVPGIGWLDRRIRAVAEEAADAAAVTRGASGAELARAILAEGEQQTQGALLGGNPVLTRVKKLVARPVRPPRPVRAVRAVLATYAVASVLASSFFGYH